MKLIGASLLLAVLLWLSDRSPAHFRPNTEHNRIHAITYAFCHSLRPCALGYQALRVAYCESGPSLWPWARNGQYLGTWQMGEWARAYVAQFGAPWSWGIWAQSRSASKLQSKLGWSQWSCASIVGIRP